MRKFKFKLAGLLRLREARAKEILHELAQVQALCEEKSRRIEAVNGQVGDWSTYYDKLMRASRIGEELALTDRHIQSLHRCHDELTVSLEILSRKREDVTRQYIEASREVKMLESLQDRRRSEHMQEQMRLEDKISDESATLRYAREALL